MSGPTLIFCHDFFEFLIAYLIGLEIVVEPHVKHLEGKLWEMRLMGRDGNCTRSLRDCNWKEGRSGQGVSEKEVV